MDPLIVGLDAGYSNLKVAWGTAHAKPYTRPKYLGLADQYQKLPKAIFRLSQTYRSSRGHTSP